MKSLALFAVLILFFQGSLLSQQEPADLILTGGKIVTVDTDFSIASAIAIRGDRILAVGDNAEIEKLSGPATEKIDLAGATVLPGLIDSHVHAVSASMYEFDHVVPEMETIDDVLAYIRTRADALEHGQWIRLSKVFITRLRERRFPTRAELDQAAPANPAYFRTGPDAALNSLALEISGIDKNFQVPEGSKARIERDPATGLPTGIIRAAGGLVKSQPIENPPAHEDRVNQLAKLIADYNKVGLTSVAARNASASATKVWQDLHKRGELTCRTYLYYSVSANASLPDIEKRITQAAKHPLREYNNRLWLHGVKIFLDGGMLTGSAYMLQPWGLSESYGIVEADYLGMRYVEPDKLYQIAKLALENDLQMTAHAVGDGAVETLVDAYARIAENDFPIRTKRPCITHCNFMSERAIDLMAKHGIVADLQPAWLYLDGSTLTHHFGDERLTWFQPYKTLFEKGVIVGGGSDHMQKIGGLRAVNPYNPFLGMWIALTRQPRWMDTPTHPEQRITREQAIRLYTINNAYLTFEEKEKGSLEPGKLADFILLDRNILACPLDEVREIQVTHTYLGGEQIYPR